MVEGALPLGKRLETVHHTPVETIGRGSNEQEDDPRVEDNNPRVKKGKLVRAGRKQERQAKYLLLLRQVLLGSSRWA